MDATAAEIKLRTHPAYLQAVADLASGKLQAPAAPAVTAAPLPGAPILPRGQGVSGQGQPGSQNPAAATPGGLPRPSAPLNPAAQVTRPIPATAPVGATTAIPEERVSRQAIPRLNLPQPRALNPLPRPVGAGSIGLPRTRDQVAEKEKPDFFNSR